MSRKRFIKLMMARGYSRNMAAMLATEVSRYGSYSAMYQQLVPITTLVEVLLDMVRGMLNALAVICDSIATVFSSIAANIRRVAGE